MASAHARARLDKEELEDWRAGRDAVYQLAALTAGARLFLRFLFAQRERCLPVNL